MSLDEKLVKRYTKYNLVGGSGVSLPPDFYSCPEELKKAFPRTLCKESTHTRYRQIDYTDKELIELLFPHITFSKNKLAPQKLSFKEPQKKNKKKIPSYWYKMDDNQSIKPDGNQQLFKIDHDLRISDPYPIIFYESDTFKKGEKMEGIITGRAISPWKRRNKGKYEKSWDGT